ncbi:unnamed protein product [Ceutorhynchus assimilis]|uniref:Uncharacterized protein n=1 Tax=Ceutorhynchus assimilis TaxID=467358 RepID=A0A9N9QRK0_9CUCU|nr:unnamed protein product [Ceutorhynchus assimilis]
MAVWDVEWFSQTAENVKKKTWLPWGPKKYPRRAILKDGHENIYRKSMKNWRRWRFLQDIVNTLLDAQWRWTLQFLALEFFGCWLVFALLWWLIAFVHGDLHDDHLPLRQAETGWNPCVLNIYGFHSAFLYSLETQHTTGYGSRAITEECPEAIFLLVCQCLIGMTLDSFAISIVFAKLIRSKHATSTIQFSKKAVISHRDGKLCFMIRVGDIRRSKLVAVGLRAIAIKNETTQEGEILPSFHRELELQADNASNNPTFLWPLIVYHEINKDSALYEFSEAEKMRLQKIEIVVVLSATVESTGVSIEAKSSYLAREILWGYKFESMVSYNKCVNCYESDWKKFDNVRKINSGQNLDDDEASSFSDTDETKLLNSPDDGASCSTDFLEPLNYKTLHSSTKSSVRNEMINFEDTDELPAYKKPASPITDKLKHKRSFFQRQPSKYDNYPETIDESDEEEDVFVTSAV